MFAKTRRNFLIVSAAGGLALCSFASGYVASIHLRRELPSAIRLKRLSPPGDASPSVRAGVIQTLQALQEGYAQRDPSKLDGMMGDVFDPKSDLLALGTEGAKGEWVRGYGAVEEFIRHDWQAWGNVKLDVRDADVWSKGDVAWLATNGVVQFERAQRPLRFTAVLTRSGDRWLIRQMQFQWDDTESSDGDLLHARTYLRLLDLSSK